MRVSIRPAGVLDLREMADLLNEIITRGGTTAITTSVDRATLAAWMDRAPDRSAWHVAEDHQGRIVGFQWIEPHDDLPADTCDIASFVRVGVTGIGIGSALFEASRTSARRLGYRFVMAVIRADNAGGLAYYQSRGFEDHDVIRGLAMADGCKVDRVMKRYDLR